MRNSIFCVFLIFTLFIFGCTETKTVKEQKESRVLKSIYPQPVDLKEIMPSGDLALRTEANFARMHLGRYRPEFVHTWPSIQYHQEQWPADLVGRVILTLSLEEQALSKKSQNLKRIVHELEENMNEKGYCGKIYTPDLNEQQLSGHGWLLNGLVEYYKHTGDEKAKELLQTMVDNLILPTKGMHKTYPIDPDLREDAGGYMGTHQKKVGNWILSSDIGCDFIFMDGVIKVYEILPSDELKDVIEEMISRFLEIDQEKIKAQTHSTMTSLRGLLRYAQLENRPELIAEVQKRFDIYKKVAMTENYENYNWYGRPRWTEPCAVVDSYIVAINLWRLTGNTVYLADAQHIFYNGMGFEQRYSGSFGCSSCLGAGTPMMILTTNDTHWCCTMRGGVGLSRAIQYAFFIHENNIYIPDFKDVTSKICIQNNTVKMQQKTEYPYNGKVAFEVLEGSTSEPVNMHFYMPEWIKSPEIKTAGETVEFEMKNGFAVVTKQLSKGTIIELSFDMVTGSRNPVNENTIEGYYAFHHGPLLLGTETAEEIFAGKDVQLEQKGKVDFLVKGTDIELHPVGHLLHPDVRKEYNAKEYQIQALFSNKE